LPFTPKATEASLLQHREFGLDGAFYDTQITILASLIGCRMDMSDGGSDACPFSLMSVISEPKILRSSRNIYWDTQRLSYLIRESWVDLGVNCQALC
jgi:uroporphyrinogen-III decarboxylase